MCCFSRGVRFVGGTKIFARGLPDGRQVLVYAMNVELDEELAMILPLPVPPAPTEDAVSFVSLEGEEAFFDELAAAFPAITLQAARLELSLEPPPRKLAVHEVGQYEASFVPSAADFGRLDERFRLPNGFLAALPAYADYGFAVFRLKPRRGALGGAKLQSVHPMALLFPRRDSRSLFFPTVHVHDGKVSRTAGFDHALYCQADGVLGATLGWTASNAALGEHVAGVQGRALVEVARGGFAQSLWGELDNADVWLREPKGVQLAELQGGAECHAFEIKATAAYTVGWRDPARAAWTETAARGLAKLCRGLRAELLELEATQRARWRLGPLSAALPPHFMNGSQLWSGTTYMNGAPAKGGGAGQVRFTPFSQLVEPQAVTLGFTQLPTQEEASTINAELSRVLDRAAT